MTRQKQCSAVVCSILPFVFGLGTVHAAAPIDIGSHKQLFIDDKFIASSNGIELTMNTPAKIGQPVLASDMPWDDEESASVGWYSSVIKDGDKIRIWGSGQALLPVRMEPGGPVVNLLPYAESTDGIHFTKPDPALIAYDKATAEIEKHGDIHGTGVWIDPKAPPSQRYKTQAKYAYTPPDGTTRAGIRFLASPDGYNWTVFSTQSLGAVDTQTVVFWDEAEQKYLMYTRDNPGGGTPLRRRVVRRIESRDLLDWENDVYVMDADAIDNSLHNTPTPQPPVDYYGATVFKYPDTGSDSAYIMMAHAYWHWQGRPEEDQRGNPSYHTFSQVVLAPAKIDVRLLTSRNGIDFLRQGNRKPFIAPGLRGTHSSKFVWSLPAPIRMGNELWVYYVGDNRDHDGFIDPAASGHRRSIERAILRLDGFVSADAAYTGGEIITPLIQFSGRKLELNMDPGGGGFVQVELLDENSRPIPGYTRREATRLYDNAVNVTVTWGDNNSVAAFAGKPVKLRFLMRDCKLYAFQFVDRND
ncbi:MAG: hypothetical protein R6W95_06950 [Desulfosarcina sp.]